MYHFRCSLIFSSFLCLFVVLHFSFLRLVFITPIFSVTLLYRMHFLLVCRAALTGKHDTLVRRAPGWQGAPDGQQTKKLVVYFT